MNETKLAIIGPGNVGMGIYNGKVNYSPIYGVHNISLIKRDYFTNYCFEEHLSNFENRKLNNFDNVFLSVKPKDAVYALGSMRGKIKHGSTIISSVSGLNTDVMGKMLGGSHDRLVKCTLNLGVSYGTGMVVYHTCSDEIALMIEEFFRPLTLVTVRKSSKIVTGAVTIVGSGSAFFAKYLFLRFPSEDLCFKDFIENLTMSDPGIRKYIEVNKYGSRMVLNDDSLVEDSVRSTLETLKKFCLSPECLLKYIARVATEGGCTRLGIDDFDSLEKLSGLFFMNTFSKIHKKVKSFSETIVKDFNEWVKKTNTPKVSNVPSSGGAW